MTDKQIIVDVTQCPYYREGKFCVYLSYKTKCEGNCIWTSYKEMEEQLDQLKAENENWQKEYWKLEQGNDFLAETNSRLKQTLTEIKEIAEQINITIMGGSDSPKDEWESLYHNTMKAILQKISECEV